MAPITEEGRLKCGPQGHDRGGSRAKVLVPLIGVAREVQGKVQNLPGSKRIGKVGRI